MSEVEYNAAPDITVQSPDDLELNKFPIGGVDKLTIEILTKHIYGYDNAKSRPVAHCSFKNIRVKIILTGSNISGIAGGDVGQLSFVKNGHKVATMLVRSWMPSLSGGHIILESTDDCSSDTKAIFVVGEPDTEVNQGLFL